VKAVVASTFLQRDRAFCAIQSRFCTNITPWWPVSVEHPESSGQIAAPSEFCEALHQAFTPEDMNRCNRWPKSTVSRDDLRRLLVVAPARRVVLVMLEQSDDLLLRHFWLLTSINANTLDGDALLALYRQRGTAEGHWRRRCPRSRVPGGPTPPMHLPTSWTLQGSRSEFHQILPTRSAIKAGGR
jgi:hypothetical protein